jgi:hypothetical protein
MLYSANIFFRHEEAGSERNWPHRQSGESRIVSKQNAALYNTMPLVSYRIIQGVQKVTQPMAYLESAFTGRLISKRLWPPRSPDLSPHRLLFMGTSQGYCVFKSSTHTHTLQELLANIQRIVDRILTGTLQNVFANMIRRVHLCEERNGGHFQHLL